ncbi:MAG: alpha/beta fold hydrolase [Chloroflexi bacterium]|nr:alpha/beta fold hydrolase [Chloroflexota bacterium]
MQVVTPVLHIEYSAYGPEASQHPVVLLHGFPYDPHAFDAAIDPLVAQGLRVYVPYLRGYGPTRFRTAETPRSGQQVALARDALDFMDALDIHTATLAGYDWGGRAACIVAALWPERVHGLVTVGGRLLWRLWSPTWQFSEETYARSAASFDNPDFVDVVIQSYRHRYGYAPGDPGLEPIEAQLAQQPPIDVPTIALYGMDDGVSPFRPADRPDAHFTGPYERRDVPGVGHNLPQESPKSLVSAIGDLIYHDRSEPRGR